MKFAFTIIYVPDVPAALDFYVRAFGLQVGFLHESKAYGELQLAEGVVGGGAKIAFASESMAEFNGLRIRKNAIPCDAHADGVVGSPGIEVVFASENVEVDYGKAVEAGATGLVPPKTKPWGQLVAYVRDPNGIIIELYSPIEE